MVSIIVIICITRRCNTADDFEFKQNTMFYGFNW